MVLRGYLRSLLTEALRAFVLSGVALTKRKLRQGLTGRQIAPRAPL